MAKKNALAAVKGKVEKTEADHELEGLMSEIESDLREEELKKLWKRHGTLIVAGAIALVLGVLGVQLYRQYEARERTAVALRYDQATHDLDAGKLDAALAGYKDVAGRRYAGGFKVLAELGEGAALLKKNDEAGAVKVYAAIAADTGADPMYRDLATILGVLHSMDTADPNTLEAALARLMGPNNPFHSSATELSAVLAAKQGDSARARQLAEQILADSQAPAGVRQRAGDLAALYKAPETGKAETAEAEPAKPAPATAPPAASPAPAPAKPAPSPSKP